MFIVTSQMHESPMNEVHSSCLTHQNELGVAQPILSWSPLLWLL